MPEDTPDDLNDYIPRPDRVEAKRHMLAVGTSDYEKVSELAVKYDTSRGRVVTALLAFYFSETVE